MGSETAAWLKYTSVCGTIDDTSWYVCYDDKVHRLRLTMRGTWSRDDMDIYFRTKGEAFAALHVAPCPLEDPYARIAALEATERELREAVKVMAVASMGAEDAKWRMRECQKSIAGACGQTVQECFAAMRYHNVPSSIFDRFDEAMQAAMANPIASAAVREAAN